MSLFRNIFSHFALNAVVLMFLILSLLFGYEKFEPERTIKVATGSVTNVSYASCSVQGTILDKGKKGIDQHGFCWAVTQNPTTANNKTQLGSNSEWTTLTDYLGGESVAGGKLKEAGTTHWDSPNTGATNESGFTALPGGHRLGSGEFDVVGGYGYWWASTENDATSAWFRYLSYSNAGIYRNIGGKKNGFSVRCVRDN